MKTAIIVAMDKELALMLPLIEDRAEVCVGNATYYTGRIGRHEVVVGKCGIGKVNAALGASAMLDTFHPALLINSGVAGGTGIGSPALKPLDVIMPHGVAYHDVWCGPGTVAGQASGFPTVFECPLPDSIRTRLDAKGGLLASGDVFVTGDEAIARVLETQPEAVAVDMESAALAQTCHTRAVPFVCVRVISDVPGEGGNIAAYENFWTDAPARTFQAVEKLLELL